MHGYICLYSSNLKASLFFSLKLLLLCTILTKKTKFKCNFYNVDDISILSEVLTAFDG